MCHAITMVLVLRTVSYKGICELLKVSRGWEGGIVVNPQVILIDSLFHQLWVHLMTFVFNQICMTSVTSSYPMN